MAGLTILRKGHFSMRSRTRPLKKPPNAAIADECW